MSGLLGFLTSSLFLFATAKQTYISFSELCLQTSQPFPTTAVRTYRHSLYALNETGGSLLNDAIWQGPFSTAI